MERGLIAYCGQAFGRVLDAFSNRVVFFFFFFLLFIAAPRGTWMFPGYGSDWS